MGGSKMSERPTPETDAARHDMTEYGSPVPCSWGDWIPIDVAKRLERERDEAREDLKHITEYGTEEINAAVELRQKLAQALVDLDNMQDQRDFAMKVIKRLEQERDEAVDDAQKSKAYKRVLKETNLRQTERIRYLEGATNHACGTPLSVALRERDEAREEVKLLKAILDLIKKDVS
jgi:hypothetical protein